MVVIIVVIIIIGQSVLIKTTVHTELGQHVSLRRWKKLTLQNI